MPAIDPDDEPEEDHPDRSYLRTGYRRSPVSLGPLPFLDDDGYAARICAALAAGTRVALGASQAEVPAPATRQRILLRATVEALAALPLREEERVAYLGYHRDWLLRFFSADAAREAEVRERLDAQVDRMGTGVDPLREAAAAAWAGGGEPPAARSLGGAMAALYGCLDRYRGDPAAEVDPFAPDVAFPAVFKALHGLANQLGLPPTNEAFVHHLLLRAVGGAAVPA